MRIFTWHVHGSYLFYLSQAPHDFFVPVKPGRPAGYGGRAGSFPWPDNLHEVAAGDVRRMSFDCVLFQSRANYEHDQHEILSAEQRRLPRIYLEHDPPREHPTDTRHLVDDPDMLLVHVTAFNDLMWNSNRTPTRVIDHGVSVPAGVTYTGEIPRGVVVINGLATRGRRLGADVFARVREDVPLDLVGMQSEAAGGLGEVAHDALPAFESRYRFFFNPIRYTSLGLAVCEAMMLGMPIVALATTEMATVIENGVSGCVDTSVQRLIGGMRALLDDPVEARRLGEGARLTARERFGIGRFARDWDDTFRFVAGARALVAVGGTA
jgi:glycosyltransferase involved in cell wall biosynthesis